MILSMKVFSSGNHDKLSLDFWKVMCDAYLKRSRRTITMFSLSVSITEGFVFWTFSSSSSADFNVWILYLVFDCMDVSILLFFFFFDQQIIFVEFYSFILNSVPFVYHFWLRHVQFWQLRRVKHAISTDWLQVLQLVESAYHWLVAWTE